MRLVLRAGRRSLLRHPVQLVLAVTGIAIGVAVVVAVDLANHSAREAMRQAVDRVAGRATHQIVGGPAGVPDAVYRRLRVDLGVRRAAPVVEGGVTLPGHDDRPLTVLGVDPLAEAPFRGYLRGDAGSGAGPGDWLAGLLVRGDGIVLSRSTGNSLGVAVGDSLELLTSGGRRRVRVLQLVDSRRQDLSGLAFTDIAAAQEWFDRVGRLGRIDLILDGATRARVAASLPRGVSLIEATGRGGALAAMSDAFRLNLSALSLLALLVGLFLVFNTMSFLVVQRRRHIGVLRAVGVTRSQVTGGVLADAAMIGLAGTLVGLPLGVLLGTGVTELVLRTIDELYFQAIGGLRLDVPVLAKGAALGIGGTLLAALPAVREAAGVPPRQALSRGDLEQHVRRNVRWLAGTGALLGLAGLAGLRYSTGLVAGFVGLFTVIIAFVAVVPLVVARLAPAVAGGRRAPLWWRLCIRGAAGSLSRTGVAVAALTAAVAAVIGVSVMIDSFRSSVREWLERTLQADYYVSAAGPMEPSLADRIAAVNGVGFVTRSRFYRIPTSDGLVSVWGLALPRRAWSRFDIRVGDPDRAWRAFRSDSAVLVSEPYAHDHHLEIGDALVLPGGRDDARYTVAGVFRDYGAVEGVVLMSLRAYRRHYGDRRLTGLGVHLAGAADPGRTAGRLRTAIAGVPGARLRDNQRLFDRSLEVFDQTFAITSVLRLLAAVVAFVGVLGALMALQLDRRREYATYRALGLTRGQLAAITLGESGVLGTVAGLCAVPLGVVLAWLLVFVINRRAFGWTMDFVVKPWPLADGVALALVAALLAAVYPAWRLSRRPPAHGLGEE